MVKPTLHSWGASHSVWVHSALYTLLDSVCSYFLVDFGVFIFVGGPVCTFLVIPLCGFDVRVTLVLEDQLGIGFLYFLN